MTATKNFTAQPFLEQVWLCGEDGLVRHKNKLHYHFQKYPWNLENSELNPGESEHSRRIKKRLLKGIPTTDSSVKLFPSCHTETETLSGRYHLGISPHMSSYYHFICDLLPHLLKYPRLPLLISEDFPPSFSQFLLHQGFVLKKLISSKHYHVEQLFLPEMPTPDWNVEKIKLLQNFFFAQTSECPISSNSDRVASKRIYISRKFTERRHLSNEDVFLPLLKEHGFERVFLEKLPILEQVVLLQNATHVITPHGAGLVNGLFSSEQTRILEIRPIPSSGQFCFDHLFALGWKRYEVYIPPFKGRFELDPEVLQGILERWKKDDEGS